jgi:hypothetical protein
LNSHGSSSKYSTCKSQVDNDSQLISDDDHQIIEPVKNKPLILVMEPTTSLVAATSMCRQLELHLQFRPLSSLFLPGKKEINKHLQGKLQAEGNGVSLETRRIVCLSFSEWKQKGNFIHACIQTTPVNLDLPNIPVRW